MYVGAPDGFHAFLQPCEITDTVLLLKKKVGGVGVKIDLPDGMHKADRSEWRDIAEITAEAFSEDPVMTWMMGTHRGLKSVFRTLAREAYVPRGVSHIIPGKGATMWEPWGVDVKPTNLQLLMFAIGQTLYGSKGAVQRGIKSAEVMAQHHPKERHWYLLTVGTTKAARGQGIGKTLLRPVLEACDREGMPVYLENSNRDNSGFYRAHGFERCGDPFELAPGSPCMEPMWREPKSTR